MNVFKRIGKSIIAARGETIFTEVSHYMSPCGLEIKWHCQNCDHHINMMEQQHFKFCFICGAKVTSIRHVSLTHNPLT